MGRKKKKKSSIRYYLIRVTPLRESVIYWETLNQSSAAEQRVFCPHAAGRKTGNTSSIPPFSGLCLRTKSLAVSSRRFNQSFLYYKKIDPSSRNRDERHSFRGTTRNSPKRRAFRMQTHPRPLTQSRGQLYFSFKRQLPGESPALHASGSHHPALSDSANQHKAAHSTLFPYRPHISIYG